MVAEKDQLELLFDIEVMNVAQRAGCRREVFGPVS
jgi:hypothetical protein